LFRIDPEGKHLRNLLSFLITKRREHMKSIIVSMAVAAGLMVAGSAMATDMPAVAKKLNCTACHAIDKKVVGPAWAEVAKKYKGDAGAEAKLITKVSKGGGGVWGSMPMPANDAAGTKQADIKEVVKFILAL
jgi:cytochrome c